MKRRDFIRRTVPVTLIPFFIDGFPLKMYGRTPLLEMLVNSATETDRVLVLVQMSGGNDGLNTVIPIDQYSSLSNARSNILLDETKVLKMSDATGLHPSLSGMFDLYNNSKLAVVQSVSYPNPSFSHFRATDIWLSASDTDQQLDSGWAGRYLSAEFPDYPNGYPNTVMPDPLAIQIGSVVSPSLQGPSFSMGMAITNPTSFYQLVTGTVDPAPNTPAGHELTYIRLVSQQTQQYANTIKTAAGKATNQSTLYPASPDNILGDQLKIVARLVAGGLKTRIYVVNIGGFDTHSNQVVAGQTDTGTHATLLNRLSLAIAAFQDDCRLLGIEDRVIGMTFSEFGRRIKSNASGGTDHGAAAPLFVFGKGINGGILGTNPALPASATVNDNIPMQFDFRSVYASVLKDWFGVPQDELNTVLLKDFQDLPLINSTISGVKNNAVPHEFRLQQNYPNPFNPSTTIAYDLPGDGSVRLEVFDITGRNVALLVDRYQPAGHYEVRFDASSTLASGAYICQLRFRDAMVLRNKMVLLR